MKLKSVNQLFSIVASYLIALISVVFVEQTAAIAGSPITAKYYKNGVLIYDDHYAEFELVTDSKGNPSLGNTVRVIRWSNGTTTHISLINGQSSMGKYPAESFGVGHVGGRIYESYCVENTINERVCYKFK